MENQGASQVWAEVTALARLPGVLDLGQGWPDMGASEVARVAASEAILSDDDPRLNQYSTPPGEPELVSALNRYYRSTGSLPDDAVERDVIVTASATEALYVTMQALCGPGDEIVFLEPFFPWYISHARIFGATPRTVRLRTERPDDDGDGAPRFRLDLADLRAAFVAGAGRTKAFIHCNPHNPTGIMFTEDETCEIAKLCDEFDVLIVADEVYERCTFSDETPMVRVADVSFARGNERRSVRARTLQIGSASKLLCLSGWRVGWVMGPKPLIAALRTMHSYVTFCAPTPLQIGVAAALRKIAEEAETRTALAVSSVSSVSSDAEVSKIRRGSLVPDAVASVMTQNVSSLSRALCDSGVTCYAPLGGYFLVADVSTTGLTSTEYCKALAGGAAKVACVPMDVFFDASKAKTSGVKTPDTLVRFAVCKQRATILKCAEAIRKNPIGNCAKAE
jgi:aspartate/methionine/tyrosine aminotransferase